LKINKAKLTSLDVGKLKLSIMVSVSSKETGGKNSVIIHHIDIDIAD